MRPPQSQKPQLERRRRARINASLGELGGLLLPLLGLRELGAGVQLREVSPLAGQRHPAVVRPARSSQPQETCLCVHPSPAFRVRNSGHQKLEKADILEMTVRFLRGLPVSPPNPEPESGE